MKRSVLQVLAAAVVIGCMNNLTSVASEPELALTTNTQRMDLVVIMITSTNKLVQWKAIRSVLNERQELVRRLSAIAGAKPEGEYADEARAAAAYLLGELRAAEAAPALASAVGYPLFHGEAPDGETMNPIRSPMAIVNALSHTGDAALREAIRTIRTTDDKDVLQGFSRMFARLLYRKAWALDVLKSLTAREENADAKRRLQAAHDYLVSCKGDDTDMIIDALQK